MGAMGMPLYPTHIATTSLQRALLAAGSAIAAINNPYRHDMVAVCGETTGTCALRQMLSKMKSDPMGQDLLQRKPRINSSTVDLVRLRRLEPETFGRKYVDMLDKFNITPDSRMPVKFVDDPELAYVMQRYRETHDFIHLLLDQPTNMLGEVVVKWFEAIQTGLPMCYMAAIAGPSRLSQKQKRILIRKRLPWAVETATTSPFFMNIEYERRFEDLMDNVRTDMKITLIKRPKR